MNDQRTDNGFREFVVGFSDPLARLAYLLTAGTSTGGPDGSVTADAATAHSMTIDALARVKRHWHDAGTTGAPEPVAVDALVAALPRLRRRPVAAVVEAAPLDVSTVVEDDIDVWRAGLWRAWTTLAPRQRVPLLFIDASVASRRLAGLDVPESFGRTRSRDALAAGAVRDMKTSLLADPSTRAVALDDGQLFELLADVLREYASTTATPIDPYPVVASRVRQVRARTALAVGVAVVVVVATATVAVNASKTTKAAKQATAAPANATLNAPFFSPVPVPRGAAPAALAHGVVNWPVRGTAANSAVLIAQLKDSFVHAHPDATGTVQVLLATDTPAFRVAYVTATSPRGVIQSWFYGAVGSTDLVEGEASYGGALVADASVLASAVIDGQGQGELVVIAPPATNDMQLADFDFSKPVGPGFEALPYQDGVAVSPIDITAVSALILHVRVGANVLVSQNMPIVTLGPPAASGAAPFQPASPGPSLPVERGKPDQQVLTQLVRAATVWHDEDAPGQPMQLTVLWGGTDEAGTHLVVGRLKMRAFDVLLLQWNNDAPGVGGEYLIDRGLPDAPLAFAYRGLDGTRIGVIASPGLKGSTTFGVTSALAMPGQPAWAAPFDRTGFASIALPQANRLTDLALNVDLLDKAGHLVEVIPMPPPA